VTATQGALRATNSFTVQRPSAPRSLVRPEVGRPGSIFRVALAGFQPHQTVVLHLYRHLSAGSFVYATLLDQVTLNEQGEAIYELRTAADDPESRYAVETEPPSGRVFQNRFFVHRQADRGANELAAELNESPGDQVLAAVAEANRVWAAVMAKDGAPLSDLDAVYAGPLLEKVRAEASELRERRQYRQARLTAPLVLVRLDTPPNGFFEYEATVEEHWDNRLYNGDGSLIQAASEREVWRYLVKLHPRDPAGELAMQWRILRAELVRQG
jgi:hypothetical protein